MKKRTAAWLLAALSVIVFASCDGDKTIGGEGEAAAPPREPLQIGLIVSEGAYGDLHVQALKAAAQSEDRLIIRSEQTAEACYSAALELAELKCDVVFAAGEGLEDFLVQAATEEETTHFCMAEGVQAEQIKLPNLHSYAVAESESRYLSGIAAGMKLNDMIENGEILAEDIPIGYIGTTANAENRSAYTAFYLGVKSVCPGVSLYVQYSGAEHDAALEEDVAAALIANGCKLIAQHSAANGAAEICGQNNVYFVGSLTAAEGAYWVTSVSADWSGCYAYAMDCIGAGETLPNRWSRTGCEITQINEAAFVSEAVCEEAESKVAEAKTALQEDRRKVFDTSLWTVNGETVTSTAGEDLWFDYYGEEYIGSGYFKEYEYSSQPKFMFVIDGITELN